MIHVGIDLGTTYSKIGQVTITGSPALFPDIYDTNSFKTPSAVHIGQKGIYVGQSVEGMVEEDPELPVIRFVKLQMGSPEWNYQDHKERKWSPQAISALILKKLKKDAESYSHEQIGSAVITVPAQFGSAERRATQHAGLLAGLNVSQIIEEPVAAATYYGISEEREQTLFVYDLGGGTFDATVLRVSPAGLRVLATEGSRSIGGKWFDDMIMNFAAEEYKHQHGFDPRRDRKAENILRRFAHEAKISLCMPGVNQVNKTVLLAGRTCEFLLTRAHFEKMIVPLVDETLHACERGLQGASLTWKEIDRVLIVGGSSLVPLVKQRVQQESGKDADQFVQQQPHQAVGFGASILAEKIGGGGHHGAIPDLVHQIASYHLGLRVQDPRTGKASVQVLIARNTPLPAEKKMTFYTARPDQQRIVFEIVQSKGDDTSISSLGHFAFGPIKSPRKNYPVEVTAAYDNQGIVRITAHDAATGQEMERLLTSDSNDSGMFFSDQALVSAALVNES